MLVNLKCGVVSRTTVRYLMRLILNLSLEVIQFVYRQMLKTKLTKFSMCLPTKISISQFSNHENRTKE